MLSDKNKREVYDKFGEEGLKAGGAEGGMGGFPGGAGGFPGGGGFSFRASNPEDIFKQVWQPALEP